MLNSLREDCCIPYMVDVLCFAKIFEAHIEVLICVLRAVQLHSLKLRPTNCELFKKEGHYVGRLVSPSTVGEVHKLVGFLSYYRAYVQDFSKIFKSIYELLQAKNIAMWCLSPGKRREKGYSCHPGPGYSGQKSPESPRPSSTHPVQPASAWQPLFCATHGCIRTRA